MKLVYVAKLCGEKWEVTSTPASLLQIGGCGLLRSTGELRVGGDGTGDAANRTQGCACPVILPRKVDHLPASEDAPGSRARQVVYPRLPCSRRCVAITRR